LFFPLSLSRPGIGFATVVPRILVSEPWRQLQQHWFADRNK
jgi:hypothetical protein